MRRATITLSKKGEVKFIDHYSVKPEEPTIWSMGFHKDPFVSTCVEMSSGSFPTNTPANSMPCCCPIFFALLDILGALHCKTQNEIPENATEDPVQVDRDSNLLQYFCSTMQWRHNWSTESASCMYSRQIWLMRCEDFFFQVCPAY